MDTSAADVRRTSVGAARPEGDPLPSLTAADAGFVDALRSALATDPATAMRPGLLRQKVEAALGPGETARLRPLVHQVVAACEENLPGYLTRIRPLTPQSLAQLSGELARARGWNEATAQRVTQIWAHALGFSGVADGWPDDQPDDRPGDGPDDRPGTESAPSDDASADAALPGPGLLAGATALPPAPVALSRETGGDEHGVRADPRPPTSWPTPSRRLARRHSRSTAGEAALGVARAYAGMSLQVYSVVVSVFVGLVILGFLLLHLLVGVVPVLVVVYLMRRALKAGVLVATASGLEFTTYSPLGNRPQAGGVFAATWAEVTGDDGAVTVLQMAGRRIQLGPLSRQFARAALEHAGRGA